MEVFCRNLDSESTNAQAHDAFRPLLLRHGISTFDVRKCGKTIAKLTIADFTTAGKFLASNPSWTAPSGRTINFSRSRTPPNAQVLRILQKEEKDSKAASTSRRKGNKAPAHSQDDDSKVREVRFSTLRIGCWETDQSGHLRFVSCYSLPENVIILRRVGPTLVLSLSTEPAVELAIDVMTVSSITVSSLQGSKVVVFDLDTAPRMIERPFEVGQSLDRMPPAFRVTKLPGCKQLVAGCCLAYYLTLAPHQAIDSLKKQLRVMTSYQISVDRSPIAIRSSPRGFQGEVDGLNEDLLTSKLSFACKFQIQKLWANALLSPSEVRLLVPMITSIHARLSENLLVQALRGLAAQLNYATYQAGGYAEAVALLKQQEDILVHKPEFLGRASARDEVSTHRVVVTPTGIYLYGPEEVAANRILRQHRQQRDCFLRVSFTDETEDKIQFDRDCSNERILRGRFLDILQKGLDVAGEHFDFLGFSHSSLRSQACWFMRPFVHDGSLLLAKALIRSLGDFSSIRCPAKCAARIGQAFSETTASIKVDPSIVKQVPDIKNDSDYVFTDGCGTISKATWKLLRKGSTSKEQPTSYQIRFQGAKGMITLDTRLTGRQLRLRDSMVKFTGSPSSELEICGTNARPLPFRLNRPLIKILEDLGIGFHVFDRLQTDAVNKLQASVRSVASALEFLRENLSDSASGLPTLLKALAHININVTEDKFLREIIGAQLQVQLREIKYRSRILVPEALTLYGISDETGFLKPGQVYVTFVAPKSGPHLQLRGRVAVTRSPALHPGDVQVVEAVSPPRGSALLDLQNSIVFSQHGDRDLPSMLSGGDLDGDLYNVIYDSDLIPARSETPASYLPAIPMDIGRPVTTEDMTVFFIDFMQNDQLGRIATLHQVIADDPDKDGTRSPECLKLASLHSIAVDFSKTGIPVDVAQIPRAPKGRPDFMAPSASTKVEDGIKPSTEPPEDVLEGPHRFRYYYSNRVLGLLYRKLDEDEFFEELEDDASSVFSHEADDNVLAQIWTFVKDSMLGYPWKDKINLAVQIRDDYDSNMLDIMSQYATARIDRLTEKEVFIGTIIGRSGAGSKFQREQSDFMRSRFNRELRDIKLWMEEQTADDVDGFLCLAVACLYVAVHRKPNISTGKVGPLKSFGWFAAAICVPELVNEHAEDDDELATLGSALSLGPRHA